MESVPSSAVAALAARVESLGSRLDTLAARAERRKWLTILAGGAIILGMFGYLRYLHATVSQFAEPTILVEMAAANTEPRLDAELDSLGENLVARAPEVIEAAERVVLDSPPQLAAEARRILASNFDAQVSGLEEKVYDALRGMLAVSLAQAVEKGVNLADPAQVNALVDQSIPLVRKELKGKVVELYEEYATGAESIGGTIDRLATAADLSPIEQQQRELLVTGLALIQKMESDPNRSPLQGLIEGRSPDAP